jgi:hypothetical protein
MSTSNSPFYTAVFIERSTGKQLYRLKSKPLNKFFWEKEKLTVLDKIMKDKFLDRHEIQVVDHGCEINESVLNTNNN